MQYTLLTRNVLTILKIGTQKPAFYPNYGGDISGFAAGVPIKKADTMSQHYEMNTGFDPVNTLTIYYKCIHFTL